MPRRCPIGTRTQTVLLNRAAFSPSEAKSWLKKHGLKSSLDEKPNSLRARQADPRAFAAGSLRTLSVGHGVKIVIGCPRTKSSKNRR